MDRVRFDPDNALTRDGGGRAEVAEPPQTHEPEPADPDLAARRRGALDRLRRQKPAIRTNREPS